VLACVEAHVRFGREHLQQRVPHEVQELRQTRVRGAHGVLLESGTEPGRFGERVPGELREGKGQDDVRLGRQRVPQRVRDENAQLRVSRCCPVHIVIIIVWKFENKINPELFK